MFNADQSKMKTVDFIIVSSADVICPYCGFQNYYNSYSNIQNCRKCYKAYLVDANAESIHDCMREKEEITNDLDY